MLVADAQRESRSVYLGGFVGQLVSAVIWLISSTVATIVDPRTGFWLLAIGGAMIFPSTQGLLRLSGRRASLGPANPLRYLAMQVAFTVPLVLPLAGIAAMTNPGLFYPACLIVVGAHYLPFISLYGMKTFGALAAAMLVAGFAIGMYANNRVTIGGWVGGLILFVFAFILLAAYKREPAVDAGLSV